MMIILANGSSAFVPILLGNLQVSGSCNHVLLARYPECSCPRVPRNLKLRKRGWCGRP